MQRLLKQLFDATNLHNSTSVHYGLRIYTASPPIVPTILTEMTEGIARDVSTLKADVTSLSEKTGALAGQMGTLTAAGAIEGIAIKVLAALAVLLLRRKPAQHKNKLLLFSKQINA